MKRSDFFLAVLVLLFLVGALSGVTSEVSAKSLTLKLAHVGPSKVDHPWQKYALIFAERVDKATNGRVKIETYPASQLGGDRELAEGIQYGSGDIALISTIAMNNFVKELGVWDLPYIWPINNSEVDKILENSAITEYLVAAAAKKRINIMAFFENDWRGMTSSKKAITSPADIQGQKIRVVENKPSILFFKKCGAIPTPMSWAETYTGLQQGTVDGQDNGAVINFGVSIYDVQKYYTPTKHIYCPLALIMSNSALKKLSDSDKEIVRRIAVETAREQRAFNREMNAKYSVELSKKMTVSELTPEGLEQFQKLASETYDELKGQIGEDAIDLMLQSRK